MTLLPLGSLEPLALEGESYRLAFTPSLVQERFGQRVTIEMLANEGGYVDAAGDGSWWVPSGRTFLSPGRGDLPADELAEARAHFFSPRRARDPFGNEVVTTMDAYDLLPAESLDPLGNGVSVVNDYRTLQPRLLTDPNGNRSEVAFDALGLVVGTAVMGKAGEGLGDTLNGFEPDLSDVDRLAHLDDPLNDPHAILKGATTRLVYDLFAYMRTRSESQPQPAVVHSIARETHHSDLENGSRSALQHSFSYSDGFGREIQKKALAEPGALVEGGPDAKPRWVGSGWVVFNNKGKPVRQFEPFITGTHRFEFDQRVGVSPIVFYDPVQRAVATLNPNHSWQKVVFDPWRQQSWDVNDTLLIADPAEDVDVGGHVARLSRDAYLPTWHGARIGGALGEDERAAAVNSETHAATPAVAHLDSLGRTFLTIADNGLDDDGQARLQRTRIRFDIEGNQLAVIDALGRTVMGYAHDMLGNTVHSVSMDAGERWTLNDVAGQPIRSWDSRGHEFRHSYDALRRPRHRFVSGSDPERSDPRTLEREVLFERIDYGEDEVDPETLNLRGRAVRSFDGAGVLVNGGYDFKGNLLTSGRQLASDYKDVPDWSGSPALEAEIFESRTTYDAMNRPISIVSPDQSEIRHGYNEAGLLERIEARLRGAVDWTLFVDDIDYDAKGQRQRIVYGNGVEITYDYDPLTFRLTRLKTSRDAEGDLQDLGYVYDPAGNITHIQDDAQQTIFFNNSVIESHADYRYDPVYQLIEAAGREHRGQTGQTDHNDPLPQAHPSDGQAMRRYREAYDYDAVGNILRMIHRAEDNNWTRRYDYAADSNRLLATSLPGDDPTGPFSGRYSYSDHGSMTSMPHLTAVDWDFKEQMQRADLGGGGDAFYVYDATGQRVRKIRGACRVNDGGAALSRRIRDLPSANRGAVGA